MHGLLSLYETVIACPTVSSCYSSRSVKRRKRSTEMGKLLCNVGESGALDLFHPGQYDERLREIGRCIPLAARTRIQRVHSITKAYRGEAVNDRLRVQVITRRSYQPIPSFCDAKCCNMQPPELSRVIVAVATRRFSTRSSSRLPLMDQFVVKKL